MTHVLKRSRVGLILAVFLCVPLLAHLAGQGEAGRSDPNVVFKPALFQAMKYRSAGFTRGGRSTTVTGVRSERDTFYFGGVGGGIWKTTDAGLTWNNVSDGFFEVGSIGAVAVAESDPNVVYVGTGSACPRTVVSAGRGAYKSTDAGKTWTHIGLRDAGQIGHIRIHPKDPNLVYVAALGNIFGANDERGVFRSKDGGKTWEKVLFISNEIGVFDLQIDATNPRVLYATAWRAERKPWVMISGPGGALYKSVDAGDTWTKLTNGLPTAPVGKSSVAVSRTNPNRVWTIIESEYQQGGVFRSDDGGASFRKVNGEHFLLQRPWYYTHVFADPVDENTVYVMNTGFYRSTDGGKTFAESIRGTHGDFHDLWINPDHPSIMIAANDGGGAVTTNAGKTWSSELTQPTAEIYRVTVDNQFPYRIYGAQQDNSTISVSSRVYDGVTPGEHWYAVAGCESGHISVNPKDPNIVYGNCYRGILDRYDHRTRQTRNIMPYPEDRWGWASKDLRYRFQWNAPVRVSPHNPSTVYFASQMVHRTTDEGQRWEVISGDLTRNDKTKQGFGGAPITNDSGSNETYGIIFAFEESPYEAGVLWAGSDDGLVHVSRDNGKTWQNVTPKDMPEWGTVNAIDVSPHGKGRALIAVYKYKINDFRPYIFRTDDYGRTWQRLTDGTNGIPANFPVRVVREDKDRKGLLYAGTEFGVFVSFDEGRHWQSLQLNMPVAPVTDMAVHQKDLILSTQGRAFWILDDLTPLQQLTDRVAAASAHLFKPRDAYRIPDGEAAIFYSFTDTPKDEVVLEILDSGGNVIQQASSKSGLAANAGLNRFEWDLKYPALKLYEKTVMRYGISGPIAVPGAYKVKLTAGGQALTQDFQVLKDPRVSTTHADFQAQFDLLVQVGEALSQTHQAIADINDLKDQIKDRVRRDSDRELARAASALVDKLTAVEETLYNPKIESNQDGFNYTPRIDTQFAFLLSNVIPGADAKPTDAVQERFKDLKTELSGYMQKLQQVIGTDVAGFNTFLRNKGLPGLFVQKSSS